MSMWITLSPKLRVALIVEAIVAVLILIGAIFVLTAKHSSPEPTPTSSEYISQLLQISLKYPYGWKLDTEFATIPGLDRYEGPDGYFEVNVTNDAVAKRGTIVKKYPKPITLGTTKYKYFLLTADAAHLKSIGDSVVLFDLSTPPTPSY